MAKKSSSELKAEGAELGTLIATARKRTMNFALLIAKDEGVVLEAHPTKGPDVMWRMAKANGGSAKGVMGVMNVNGKVIELTLASDDSPPGTLVKQTKKHLKDRGLAFKVVLIMPGGERMDDGEGDDDELDGDIAAAGEGDQAAEVVEDPAVALKAALTERLKALAPKVKELIAAKHAAGEKLANGLKAVAAELAGGNLEKAGQLLDAIEKAVAAALAAPKVDVDALRQQLITEFNALSGDLTELKDKAAKGVAGKAGQLETMFNTVVQGDDLKKAAAVLGLIKTFVGSELGKLAEATGSFLGALGDKLADVVEDVKDAVEDVAEEAKDILDKGLDAADDFVDSLTEDGRKKLDLQRLGFSEEDQDRIVGALETNPNAVKEAKAKLVDDLTLPDAQKDVLKKLGESDPDAFAAALDALKTMDPGGKLDTSPEKMQAAREALEAARKLADAALAKQKAAAEAFAAADKAAADAGGVVTTATGTAAAAAKALADYQAANSDPENKSPDELAAILAKTNELKAASEQAAKDLAAAQKALEPLAATLATATTAKAGADAAVATAKAPFEAANEANKALEAKKGMMDALAFGRLSPGAKPAFKDEDKASFIAAFTKDGALARSAMDLAARSDDPSAIARNVGFVADKMNDGFAADDGRKLDLPEDQRREMANNALRMGALQGEDYFKGFGDYLKTGKQLAPDPYGGMDAPLDDAKAETQRKNKIALGRTSGLGAAAMGDDGAVDFGSDAAKGAMDHMMFHPGSLNTFTPQLNTKMAEVKGLFADGTTGPKAQAVIDKTKLPPNGAPGKLTAQKLVGGTMGKDAGAVTDIDAKASVLSAMMTPLSQGPVGSCFSTAPVRAIRETDPLRAMDEYSKIATTGQFTAKDGKIYPANLNPPKGENPLMRSWEYSVATAAGEMVDSRERKKMSGAVLAPGALGGIQGIVPADKWGDKTDAVTGLKTAGVETKLRKAVAQQLKFEYNAGPPVGTPPGGGGDGSSTDGGYEIKYKGKALKSQVDFVAAMKEIGLTAAGYAEATPEGGQIATLVASAPFINSILTAYGPPPTPPATSRAAPWNLTSGGFENQTDKVLDGGSPQISRIQANNSGTPPLNQTQRTVQLLGTFLGQTGPGKKDMEMLSTRGSKADHAFNGLPNHPSLEKIKDPNSGAKIQSELIDPGVAIATTKMSVDKTARMFDDQIKGFAEHAPQDERDLLIAALKNRPTTEMTPGELKTKVETEMAAYRDAVAQKRADKYVASTEPTADNPRKAYILSFYKDQVRDGIKAAVDTALVNSMDMPQVVVADSNWGGPEGQTLFVVAPDPSTGDLKMWKKDAFSGKLTPLGKNWEDANWYKVD